MSDKPEAIKVKNENNYLFLIFECPYCEKQNVLNKSYVSVEVVCSNRGCRRVLLLEVSDINKDSSQIEDQNVINPPLNQADQIVNESEHRTKENTDEIQETDSKDDKIAA